jgi:iron complex transport system ATP-binding protein
MSAAVSARGLGLRIGDGYALADVSFEARQGEFFIIIGPNGAGKSTLLKLAAGAIKPHDGRIDLFGRPPSSYGRRELAALTAYLPQFPRTDCPFTVEEAVMLGRSPHQGLLGLERAEDRAIAWKAMRMTHVSHLTGRRLSQLSGGERQRAMIARALCQEPKLLILDEPTASLDLAHQSGIMDILETLRRTTGLTVIMVSHDLNLAAMYGDRLLLLRRGRVMAQDRPSEVLTKTLLEEAYGCRLAIEKGTMEGIPRILPLPRKRRRDF